jgi:hypothetical protein
MKKTIALAACFAAVVMMLVVSPPAGASTASKPIYAGDSCGFPSTTRVGHAALSRTGTLITVAVRATFTPGDTEKIFLYDKGCGVVDHSRSFTVPSSGHFHKTVQLNARLRKTKFFVDVYDSGTGDNETHYFRLAP